MRRVILVCILAAAGVSSVAAQDALPAQPPDTGKVSDLETVVVRGVQPGPDLWKVTKGDHVLWILGTLSPLPRDITWDSQRVEILIASAQEVVTPPQADFKSNAGFFSDLAVLPALIGVRDNPDGKKLKDVVPAEQYARWIPLKRKYIGSSDRVEAWRPIFAAVELYEQAIHASGLTDKLIAQDAVEHAAKRAGVKITIPKIMVSVDNPRAAVKEFKTTSLDDTDCFRKTLDRIDTDLGTMTARANAWSTGDLDALRKLPYTDQMTACADAVSAAQLRQFHGIDQIQTHARQAWLDAVSAALDKNQVSFAMLPIRHLLGNDGNLSRLRELGYTVEEPAPKQPPGNAPKPAATAK